MSKVGSSLFIGVFALVLAGAGCSSTTSNESVGSMDNSEKKVASSGGCGDLKVTVDGKDVSGKYTNALSYTMVSGEYRIEMVSLFNGEKFNYTCEDILGQGRIDTNDLDMVGASYGESVYSQAVNVGADNYSTKTSLKTPAAGVGSTQTVCADSVSWTGMTGTQTGLNVSVGGAFSGTYCGEKKQ